MTGVPPSGPGHSRAEPVVSALRASVPNAIGFTGSQRGCTPRQHQELQGWLACLFMKGFQWMHNGDCIGADEQAAQTWCEYGGKIFLHPPIAVSKRAFLNSHASAAPKPYLVRNRDIVTLSSVLVATPSEMTEQLRGGTWSTIRFARQTDCPLILIYPDGHTSLERNAAKAIEARRAETGTGSVHESAVAESHSPNPPHNPGTPNHG